MTTPSTRAGDELSAAGGQVAVDVHAHVVPEALLTEAARGTLGIPGVSVSPHGDSFVVSFNGGPATRPVAAGLTDSERRAEWLGDNAVDFQVIGGWLDIFGYDLAPAEGRDWSAALNAHLIELARRDPRLVPLGTVPLQDPQAAATTLADLVKSGVPGILIATSAGGRELDDPAFTELWEAADDLGAVVYLHPGFSAPNTRYQKYGLVNALARIEDSTVAVARMLYAGIPARYDRMRMIVSHGGGALPYVMGRLAHNYAIASEPLADPEESFSHLYFDSVVHDPQALEYLITRVGTDHVLLGSDYPFPIGDMRPRRIVEAAAGPATGAILGGTASKLFGVTPSEAAKAADGPDTGAVKQETQ